MAGVAQLVRALDCGSGGRGFEPHRSPHLLLELIMTSKLKKLKDLERQLDVAIPVEEYKSKFDIKRIEKEFSSDGEVEKLMKPTLWDLSLIHISEPTRPY